MDKVINLIRACLSTATEVKVTVLGTAREPYSKECEPVELANFTIKVPSDLEEMK